MSDFPVDAELLEILACPATRQPLARADEAVLDRLNAAIAAGELANVGGRKIEHALEHALVREDGEIVYAIRDGIPVLLSDEGIPVSAG